MRPERLLVRAGQAKSRYAKAASRVPFTSSDALRQLVTVFGPPVQRLPPSLRIELLYPHLQRFPHRINLFQNLETQGSLLLNVLINNHLGTRNVVLPKKVVARFCDERELSKDLGSSDEATSFVYNCIGAVNTFAGPDLCRSMVNKMLLDGPLGLSALYLDALSNNEL